MELETPRASRPLAVLGGGKTLTRNERIIYRELCANARPMKAYALLERVHQQGLRAPMTVYRALNALIRHGLAKKVASMNAFVALRHEAGKTAEAFITCRTCGRTMEIGLSQRQVDEIFSAAGMQISDVFIEAYGECGAPDCKKSSADVPQESGGAVLRRE
ncbi:Fur family transcriptional regulator [Hyphococcus sp.]|uniref:Fur family transcriptional regulator n=1 Tax=Hyphococcus sp. TaxID=2038636 RepID=UPI0035C6B2AE